VRWGGLGAQARRGDRGEEAEEQQEAGDDPIEVRERHDTHLEFQSGDPGGAGLSVWTIEGYHYLSTAQISDFTGRLCVCAPRSDARRRRKRGPAQGGAPSSARSSRWGDLGAQARRGDGRSEAEEQQENRGRAIEEPFEFNERHDTHLSV